MTRLPLLFTAAFSFAYTTAIAAQAERRTLRGAEVAIYNLAGRVTGLPPGSARSCRWCCLRCPWPSTSAGVSNRP